MNPPKGLSREAAQIWKTIFKTCKLLPPEIELLKVALEAHDEMQAARKILKESGYVIEDVRGVRVNPVSHILKDSRNSFLRAWKALGFKSEDDLRRPGRPPEKRLIELEDEEII